MRSDISQIIHELRGVLQVFNGLVRSAREYLDGSEPKPFSKEDLRKYCDIAKEKLAKFLTLIDDLERKG